MEFNSFYFWLIFPFIFVAYWAIPSRLNEYRNWVLLLSSYLLYMNWKHAFAIALIGITAICYVGGYLLYTHHRAHMNETGVGKYSAALASEIKKLILKN